METILEQQRRYHEEKERLMDAKSKEMLHKKSTVSCPLNASISTTANQYRKHLQLTFSNVSYVFFWQLREQINSDHRTRAMLDVS